jgi:hypothetical protein
MHSDSFTNVSFPREKRDLLRSAVAHYEFGNPTNFFRICGEMLIAHYLRADRLERPLEFSTNGYAIPGLSEAARPYAKDKTQKTTIHPNETED